MNVLVLLFLILFLVVLLAYFGDWATKTQQGVSRGVGGLHPVAWRDSTQGKLH